jgi:hypothetical protein
MGQGGDANLPARLRRCCVSAAHARGPIARTGDGREARQVVRLAPCGRPVTRVVPVGA